MAQTFMGSIETTASNSFIKGTDGQRLKLHFGSEVEVKVGNEWIKGKMFSTGATSEVRIPVGDNMVLRATEESGVVVPDETVYLLFDGQKKQQKARLTYGGRY